MKTVFSAISAKFCWICREMDHQSITYNMNKLFESKQVVVHWLFPTLLFSLFTKKPQNQPNKMSPQNITASKKVKRIVHNILS